MDPAPSPSRRKRLAALLAGFAVAGGVVAWYVVTASPGRPEGSTQALGSGRDVVLATPGAELSGKLDLPSGMSADDLSWRLESDGRREKRGTGSTWSVHAPDDGTAHLVSSLAGSDTEHRMTIRVVDPTSAVGRDVRTTGTVLVDGGRAIRGETLGQGARVDATKGSISFIARARTDRDEHGRVTLKGAAITMRSEEAGGAVRNVVKLDRRKAGEQKLVGDVEHLDGTRYVEVETPDAVAMVKGTRFVVHMVPRGTEVMVGRGLVAVRRQDGPAEQVDLPDSHAAMVTNPSKSRVGDSHGDPESPLRAMRSLAFRCIASAGMSHEEDLAEDPQGR